MELLNKISRKVSRSDVKTLKSIAITSMTGKSSESNADFLADLTVNSIKAVAEKINKRVEVDRSNIKIQKKQGGSVADTEQVSGIIMERRR